MRDHGLNYFMATQKKRARPTHIEHHIQRDLVYWARLNASKIPELGLLFAIPNGGKRNVREAARLKLEGVMAGVSDLLLPVGRGGYHGLFMETKRPGAELTDNQEKFFERVREEGYRAAVYYGWKEGSDILIAYLNHKFMRGE